MKIIALLIFAGSLASIAAGHERVDGSPDTAGSPSTLLANHALPATARFRPDRILIRPKDQASLAGLAALHSHLGHHIAHVFKRMGNVQVVQLRKGSDAMDEILAYKRSGLVAYAEPDYLMHVLLEPNDFRYQDGSLWDLHNTGIYGGVIGADIDARDAWDIQTDASNVIVGVVDTGIRYTHEDLAANMWVNPGETGFDSHGLNKATNGVDDDGDGWIDDVHGINTLTGTGDPWDDYGHGSHVSGTIGAIGNNGVGVVGVCWKVQLMACEFIDSSGNGSISDAITCLDYARSKGAKIINASWGSYSFTSAALRDAVNSLRDASIIFVAAAGNDNNNNDSYSLYPASYEYDNVISVAATDRMDNRAFFSNYGAGTVKLGAPGYNIFSCWNGSDSDYRYDDGTSQAAAVVSGACALVWAKYPNLTHLQVIKRILSTVDPLPSLAGKCVTGGRLNLFKAIQPQPDPVIPSVTNWMDDSLPQGAVADPSGGGDSWTVEPWNWVTNNPAPYSGTAAHQSGIISGIHMHYFQSASATMDVYPGDTLFAYVYLDPSNPPREVMLSWDDGCWEHRAYWGANAIDWGSNGTSNRLNMGPLPPTGQWVKLAVPASQMKLEGATLTGMNFMLVDGRATWDYAGRSISP